MLEILQSNFEMNGCGHLDASLFLAEHKVVFLFSRGPSSSMLQVASELLPV